ncbi:hypothetical protein QZH41_011819, partial [Actinostola sp. cb2023]
NVAVMKTARFYNSCMNTTAFQGLQPIINLIAEYGGCSVSDNYNPNVSIATRIGRAARELNVNSLVGVQSITDRYNSSTTILLLSIASLTFSVGSYLNSSKEVQESNKRRMKSFGRLLGRNDSDAKMVAIYEFEVKLAEIADGESKKLEDELLESFMKSVRDKTPFPDYRTTVKDFCEQSEFSVNTHCLFLKKILKGIYGQSFSGDEKLLISPQLKSIFYFKNLYSLYKRTISAGNASVVADYVMWQVVKKYGIAAERNSSSIGWKDCIVSMLNAFDMSLGLMYVDANFDDKSKKTASTCSPILDHQDHLGIISFILLILVEEMTDNIRHSFIERLPGQTWMDSKTRGTAKEKALAIKVSIGYPPYIKDLQKLEDHYKTFNVMDDYFTNFKAMNRFIRMAEIKTYGKPVDRERRNWLVDKSPAQVNGFYNPVENRIIYLAGIIQPPFYNPEYPRYMQYGAIGMVIGHELTHGFDGQGRLFDKYGNLDNWWSDSAASNFEAKSSCLVKQYSKYKPVFDKKINGTFTLNENIADNGGIKIAYDAYQRWASKNESQKILPGLELNPDQLFFVGFAQTWCSVYNRQGALRQIKTDNHSPGRYRVIGSLSNFEKFSQAFQCPVNSPMNPSTKCAVW